MRTPEGTRTPGRAIGRRASWLFGAALLATVIAAAKHYSEGEDFVRLAEQAKPWWLAVAFLLQAGTYLAQGEVWRHVGAAAGAPLQRRTAFALSLAKLFADQALPSAGISGSVVVARALEARGLRGGAVNAAVLVNLATYHIGYIVALAAALAILEWDGHATLLIVLGALLFVTFAAALIAGVLVFPGRTGGIGKRMQKLAPIRTALAFVEGADPRLVRSPQLLTSATALQVVIILLDAATMWALLQSLGVVAPATGVFASFMIASLVRTIGIVPGGLGTFEAASVLTLAMTGTSIPAALAATLLFRGLTFWLPMAPGVWFSRRAILPEQLPAGGDLGPYWSLPAGEVARRLHVTLQGLSSAEAQARLQSYGPNALRAERPLSRTRVFLNQLRSPLLLLLVFAALASAATGEWLDAAIVLTIVVATTVVGYSREYSAQAATAALRARIHTRTQVVRDGATTTVPLEEVVPGDVVLLSAGSLVPGDTMLLEATDCFVSESVLTGESFPVEKQALPVAAEAPLSARTNCLFLGTNVRSGTARGMVVRTGGETEFGSIARHLAQRAPETEFDRGLRQFGYLLTSAMLVLVLVVFAAHVLRGRPPVDTLLFSIALAVGLSPELLPAILSVNLARGARMMAQHGVLVRHLNAIENLGSMDVLCTDKTGTLTEGVVRVEGAYDPSGAPSASVLELAACNASLESGLANPLDDAILEARKPDLSSIEKLSEFPFDFVRKRISVVVRGADGVRLVTKGAFQHVLEICTRQADGSALDPAARQQIEERYATWSNEGIRVLAIAERQLDGQGKYSRDDERDMKFVGFLTFIDQPKEGVGAAVADLARLGVTIKVITGDNRLVARHVATLVGMRADRLLTGEELDRIPDDALPQAADHTDFFVEVDPNQKERIILALKKMGHVVGFLGDGVNDAPAMHAADTSLSVEHAVDVARDVADFVLLERSLDVIRRGVEEGRRTFANTLKYVLTTTSANLGNMVSMAAASLFLPFLPLLAGQILLNNFLSDIPAIGLADDSVDPEMVERPERWSMRFVGRFMVEFGAVSSLFDALTFGTLLVVFHSTPEMFRTAWFVESLLTELVIALVVRTRRPFYQSRPGALLLRSTIALIAIAFACPYLPFAGVFGFVPLPAPLLLAVACITALYVVATELVKRRFYATAKLRPA